MIGRDPVASGVVEGAVMKKYRTQRHWYFVVTGSHYTDARKYYRHRWWWKVCVLFGSISMLFGPFCCGGTVVTYIEAGEE